MSYNLYDCLNYVHFLDEFTWIEVDVLNQSGKEKICKLFV